MILQNGPCPKNLGNCAVKKKLLWSMYIVMKDKKQ